MESDLRNTAPTLEELPDLVLLNLVEFLDYKTRIKCRLVSRTLKYYVESIGLSVKIRVSRPCLRGDTLSTLCKNVRVAEAWIQYCNIPIELRGLNTAILSGSFRSAWLNNVVQQNHSNLRVLFLGGNCLVAQTFGSSLILPTLQNLTQLHLWFPYDEYQFALNNFNCIPGSQALEPNATVYSRIQNNMTYLMRNIRSHGLKVFDAYIEVNIQDDSDGQLNWEHEPLFEFIQTHRRSLEEVILSSMQGKEFERDLEPLVNGLPTTLKLLGWSVNYRNPTPPVPTYVNYWECLLLAQTKLEKLDLDPIELPDASLCFLLQSVFSSNTSSLTFIRLSLRIGIELDMSLFGGLAALKNLSVSSFDGQEVPLIFNLNQLSRTNLAKLVLHGVSIDSDFDGLEFIEGLQLETLRLVVISTDGYFKDPKYMLQFVKLLLRSRTLDRLWIQMDDTDGYIPEAWTEVTQIHKKEAGLQLWLANLEVAEVQDPNHRCMDLQFQDSYDMPDFINDLPRNYGYSVNLDYLDLVCRTDLKTFQYRKHPFNLLRNAESYRVVWGQEQPELKTFEVVASTQPYSSLVQEIGRIEVQIGFLVQSSENNQTFWPVSLHDLGLDEDDAYVDTTETQTQNSRLNWKFLLQGL